MQLISNHGHPRDYATRGGGPDPEKATALWPYTVLAKNTLHFTVLVCLSDECCGAANAKISGLCHVV